MPVRPPASVIRDGVLILAANGEQESAPVVPAALIAAFEIFADAYLKGVRCVLVVGGVGCKSARRDLRRFNALLASRGLPEMALRQPADDTRMARILQGYLDEAEAVRDRRGFLRPAASPGGGDAERTPLSQIQASHGADAGAPLYAAVPVIDANLCSGCDACMRICPSETLSQIKDNSHGSVYRAIPESCDACGLCRSICPDAAITLETMAPAQADIVLSEWICRSCGVPVHRPAAGASDGGDCNICRKTGQNRKLFQILS